MGVAGQFGGRVTFKFGSLVIHPSDGEFVLDPGIRNVTVKTNQDGSAAYMLKPKQPGCTIKLRIAGDGSIDWDGLLLQVGDVTIVEEDNGRTHLFTGTRLTGEVKLNVSTGEIDGLKVEGGKYQSLMQ